MTKPRFDLTLLDSLRGDESREAFLEALLTKHGGSVSAAARELDVTEGCVRYYCRAIGNPYLPKRVRAKLEEFNRYPAYGELQSVKSREGEKENGSN